MKVHESSCLGKKVYGFNMFKSLETVDYPIIESQDSIDVVNVDPNQSLFDIVFAINPDTLLPDGDIAVFMSENTHPDVRRFIEMNLHHPTSLSGDSAGQFSDLDDDVILELTRGSSESISDYRSRLLDYVKSQHNVE